MARKRNDLTVSSGVTSPPRRTVQRRVRHLASAVGDVAFEGQAPEMAPANEPGYEEIAQLAYFYWEARGCQGGSPEEDWLQAERELRSKAKSAAV